jgi:hypothetical protein
MIVFGVCCVSCCDSQTQHMMHAAKHARDATYFTHTCTLVRAAEAARCVLVVHPTCTPPCCSCPGHLWPDAAPHASALPPSPWPTAPPCFRRCDLCERSQGPVVSYMKSFKRRTTRQAYMTVCIPNIARGRQLRWLLYNAMVQALPCCSVHSCRGGRKEAIHKM